MTSQCFIPLLFFSSGAAAAVRTLPDDATGTLEDLLMRALRNLAAE